MIVGFVFALVNNVGGGRVIIHTVSRNIQPCTSAHEKSDCHHLRANLAMYTTTNFAPEFIGLAGPIEQGEDVVTPQCILYRSDASPKADIVCLCRCSRNVTLLRGNAFKVHCRVFVAFQWCVLNVSPLNLHLICCVCKSWFSFGDGKRSRA